MVKKSLLSYHYQTYINYSFKGTLLTSLILCFCLKYSELVSMSLDIVRDVKGTLKTSICVVLNSSWSLQQASNVWQHFAIFLCPKILPAYLLLMTHCLVQFF